MNKIKILRNKLKQYNIDGYVVPKNDDFFTEYSKVNRLKVISNFSGSAGLAIILKNKNYLFTDGRYTIQSQIECGKNFKIVGIEKLVKCNLFKNLTLGIDPKLFTYKQINKFFLKLNKVKFINENLIDQIEKFKVNDTHSFFHLNKNIVGESRNSKLTKVSRYLKKNKSDYLFISAPENVAWTLNIRGKDVPNAPMPNSRLIVSKTKKIYLIANKIKCKKIIDQKIINSNQIIDLSEISKLKGDSFIIDENTCSIYFENLIKSKFKIKKKEDPIYYFKSIKNKTEISHMIKSHIYDLSLIHI